jgi:hypothetical protein
LSSKSPAGRVHQEILYADQLWRQQRYIAGLLVLVGLVMSIVLATQGQLTKPAGLSWVLYLPAGLLLAGGFLVYKRRCFIEPREDGVKLSLMRSSTLIDYDAIRGVRVQPLKLAFLDSRSRMVAPMIKPLMEKPALFLRVRFDDEQAAVIRKRLGRRMMYEDTIALPIKDADAVAWEINAHLPERVGQNQGGAKRRKKRR